MSNIPTLDEIKYEKARRKYIEYLALTNGPSFIKAKHITYLANIVQDFIEDKIPNRSILCLSMPPQHGKLCSNKTVVNTTKGWKTHGELQIGDYVFGRQGQPVKVTNVMNEGQEATLEVEFTDGEKIQVHENHEWTVFDRSEYREITVETKYIKSQKYRSGNRCRFQVDCNVKIEFKKQEQNIHPYFFGLWLGDGSTAKPAIHHHVDDTASINKVIDLGYNPTNIHQHKKTNVMTTEFFGDTYQSFKAMNFAHKDGAAKYIPSNYKFTSEEDRLELLAGLIDSDGYVYQKNGRVTFTNVNKKLIDDVKDVCVSLGFRTTISKFKPILPTSGIQGKQVVYQLTFNPDINIPTALLRKKTSKLNPIKRKRGIKNIKVVEPEKGKCITVEGGIYLVGENLVPTHNSMTLSEGLPSWFVGKNPDKAVMIVSYGEEMAKQFGRANKRKITDYGKEIFGIEISKESSSVVEYEIVKQGYRGLRNGVVRSLGITGGIAGKSADLVIIDDPFKSRADAESKLKRDTVWNEYLDGIKARLSANGKIIVIHTRWHEDDFIGRLVENEPDTTLYINIPLKAEKNDVLGRDIGDSLFPEIGKNNDWMAKFEKSYNSQEGNRSWLSLYQGQPTSQEGNLLKREWWKYYDELPGAHRDENGVIIDPYAGMIQMVMSVDATFKDSDNSDNVAIQVWGKREEHLFLIDNFKEKIDFSTTLEKIRMFKEKYPRIGAIFVEDKANGSAIINVLGKEMVGIIPVNPMGNKISRANAITYVIRTGFVHLPRKVEWLNDFVEECASFPNGKHDDQVDAMTQALNQIMNERARIPIIKEMQRYQFDCEKPKKFERGERIVVV